MQPTVLEVMATVLFGVAIAHTFSAKLLHRLSDRFPEDSVGANLFELLGEVEVVFGVWAGVLVILISMVYGGADAIRFVESIDFTEPAFVFTVMCVAATRPMIWAAREIVAAVAQWLPMKRESAFLVTALTIGPWLGSLITEPAAMTLTAMILKERFFNRGLSTPLKYALIGTLFVNISIGGTLTHFAAPPVVMVAQTWDWGVRFMLSHFGWKTIIACLINALGIWFLFRKELDRLRASGPVKEIGADGHIQRKKVPLWLVGVHSVFLVIIVMTSHHMAVFLPVFLFFLGIAVVTKEYQSPIKLTESLLVGFFLGGLVVLGKAQSWWLEPVLAHLTEFPLFIGAAGLTAFTDNAALTFLGSQVPNLSEGLKYSLVAGAVAGGGLTVIANAPNPAGYGVLQDSFGPHGISPGGLLLGALPATFVALFCFWVLPSI